MKPFHLGGKIRIGVLPAFEPYFVLLPIILIIGLIAVWLDVQTVTTGYELDRLQDQKQELEDFQRQLLSERASLFDYNFIEKKARKQLGYREPKVGEQVVYIDKTKEFYIFIPATNRNNHKNH